MCREKLKLRLWDPWEKASANNSKSMARLAFTGYATYWTPAIATEASWNGPSTRSVAVEVHLHVIFGILELDVLRWEHKRIGLC